MRAAIFGEARVTGEATIDGEVGRVDGPYYPQMRAMADALIAIVGQPWEAPFGACAAYCPGCGLGSSTRGRHADMCPWLIAARALGIA